MNKVKLLLMLLFFAAICHCGRSWPLLTDKSNTSEASKHVVSSVRFPDVRIEKIDVKNDIPTGFKMTIKNIGNADMRKGFKVRLYVKPSSDSSWNEIITAQLGPLKKNQEGLVEMPFSQLLRGYMKLGTNYIRAEVDPDREIIEEVIKSNNIYEGEFVWRPRGLALKVLDLSPTSFDLKNKDPILLHIKVSYPKNTKYSADSMIFFNGKRARMTFVEEVDGAYNISAIISREAAIGPIIIVSSKMMGISSRNFRVIK